jgi:hypothetical protein
MHSYRLVSLMSLAPAMTGCGTDPFVCSDELVALTAAVVHGTGQPLTGLSVTDTVLRTGAVLEVTAGLPPSDLPAAGLPVTMIFSDEFREAILAVGDEVIVVVTAGGHSGSGRYQFGSDGCHVQKLAGPDTLVVPSQDWLGTAARAA